MLDRWKLQSNSVLISKQVATSTKENQAVIVQEDQDEYFRDEMDEYKNCS